MGDLLDRPWCHAEHICHHWFEDECSEACDRGEHAHSFNDPACPDRKSNDSGSRSAGPGE